MARFPQWNQRKWNRRWISLVFLVTLVGDLSFVDFLDFWRCTKPTPSSWVLAFIFALLCLWGICYLVAVLLHFLEPLLRTASIRRRGGFSNARRGVGGEKGEVTDLLDPGCVEYWEGRNVGRGISLFMPDSSKQKELMRKWTQQESIAVLGSGSYFLKQPDRLLWRDIPDEMLGHVRNDDSVVYAALGPEKQYFLRFRDGDTCWSLWSELSQQIKDQESKQRRVSVVCIAPAGGYFVLFDSGGWAHNRLPDTMRHFLSEQRDRLPQVDHVSVSNTGAWFISFRDGKTPRYQCHHLPRRAS